MEHDQLTGCFTRKYLYDNFSKYKVGFLIYIDIDDFKFINDTYGHSTGDHYLKIFSERVIETLPCDNSFIARLGGDEFCIILSNRRGITSYIDNLLPHISSEITCENHTIKPSFSIGAVEFPKFSTSIEENLIFADIAMYTVKKSSKNSYKIFSSSDYKHYQKMQSYKTPLLHAMDHGHISIQMIPRYYTDNEFKKSLHSYVTNVSWRHNSEVFSDKQLFTIAEHLGLGSELSNYLLQSMSSYIDTFQNSLNKEIPIVLSVNITKGARFDTLYEFYTNLESKNISKNNIIFKSTYSSLDRLSKSNKLIFKKLVDLNVGVEIVNPKELTFNALASNINIFSINYSEKDLDGINIEVIKQILKLQSIHIITPKKLKIPDTVVEDENTLISANFWNHNVK